MRSDSSWRYHTRQATAPTGQSPTEVGGNVVTSGVYDPQGRYTYGTVPDGRTWTYVGTGVLGTRSLVVETHCVPRRRLGPIRVVDVEVSTTDGRSREQNCRRQWQQRRPESCQERYPCRTCRAG